MLSLHQSSACCSRLHHSQTHRAAPLFRAAPLRHQQRSASRIRARLPLDRDLDAPAQGFAPIRDALADLAHGRFLVVIDDEDRENEGDLILAADKVTPQSMAYMVEYTSGVICIAMEGADLERLKLPLMVSSAENEEAMYTAFTVTVDLKEGISTGISASDRARTIRQLANPAADASQFRRPGHIFPLRYREGGVLARPGHTEASVDLARLAGCHPAGVLCEIVDKETGEMARTPQLRAYAAEHGLKCITIADLIRYRLRHEQLVQHLGSTPVESRHGPIVLHSFRSLLDGSEHLALLVGDGSNGPSSTASPTQVPVPVCVHHERHGVDLLTGVSAVMATSSAPSGNGSSSSNGSDSSDSSVRLGACASSSGASSLDGALAAVASRGGGLVLYMRSSTGALQDVDGTSSSGGSSSILAQCQALHLQQQQQGGSSDGVTGTGEGEQAWSTPSFDLKAYGIASQMLRALNIDTLELLSSDPRQQQALRSCGLHITSVVSDGVLRQQMQQQPQQHAVEQRQLHTVPSS